MKDLFSKQAAEYAKYRPTYPQVLYDYIFSYVRHFDCAWDCGTGNGQAAIALAKRFKQVIATDVSETQIRHAIALPNITYQVCPAEDTPFPSQSFDLVTAAQALHWFDFDLFYEELQRVLKPQGLFAAWSYDLPSVDLQVDQVINHFYNELLSSYWDPRRHFIDEKYETIPFPFKKINVPAFSIELEWPLEHFKNYIGKTWSAVQTYTNKRGSNPIELIQTDLENAWGDPYQSKKIVWPIYLLMGFPNEK